MTASPALPATTRPPRRLVVKLGTGVLTSGVGRLDQARIAAVCAELAALRAAGTEVLVVSSGAVGLGMGALGLERRPREVARKQACAAIGQSRLMQVWQAGLDPHGLTAAQVLLTHEDLRARARFLGVQATLRQLIAYGTIPVINENDTVSVEELRTSFGDNDRLAALVATLLGAPLLLLLSDVDGLYDRHPGEPEAAILRHVPRIDAGVEGLARDRLGGLSKGGMASKIAAARIVTEAGGNCIIASGRNDHVLDEVCRGADVGTLFSSRAAAVPAWKRWLGWSAEPRGSVVVDAGAREAVVDGGRSLLAAGVVSVAGQFAAGDVVALTTGTGRPFARGLVNYAADELRRIAGLKTDAIAAMLGSVPYEEVIHRDNLAIVSREEAAC